MKQRPTRAWRVRPGTEGCSRQSGQRTKIMTKDELIQKIESEWDNLQAALDGLTEEQMHQAGVVGEWSIKDVLAHITAWQTRLITTMFKAEKDVRPDTTGGGKSVD